MSEELETFIGSKEEFWLTALLRETKNKILVPHVIEQCNGMKPVSFANADILFQGFLTLRSMRLRFENPVLPPPEMKHIFYHEIFRTWLFGYVAEEGLKAVPSIYEETFLCLLEFLEPERMAFHERAIANCLKFKNDATSLTAVLAEHFFSQLTPDHSYFMDENIPKKPDKLQCPCNLDECKQRLNFGNTAIGSSVVWHGCPDIFIDQRVPVTVITETKDNTVEDDTELYGSFAEPAAKKTKKRSNEEEQSSPGSDNSFVAPVAKKLKIGSDGANPCTSRSVGMCIAMENNKSSDILFRSNIIDQIMASAMTNAFAQVNSNSHLKGLMIPSFACTQDYILVFLYDPENDILLQTNVFKLFEGPGRLSISAIVQVWMFLNFVELLKPDLANEYEFEPSRFHNSVMGYLSHYKNATYGEKLGPSESNYIGEVVMPIMFSACNHIPARNRASSS
ncbi:hypothetical protein FSP39_005698 [Pinctada imbricata]|uniref:Uncharacterized protein n=1 Tax=Pinctada imbricata TaxID=66713 RepID=A0AA89C0M0_PINIB|nr:hypothetical protein FSP39_005698 [Pinctada imbricata]